MGEFDNTSVMVTGGSSGIGLAAAELLASRGASIALCGHQAAAVESATERVGRFGTSVHGSVVDVTDEAAVRAWCDGAVAQFSGIDALVTAAGIQRYGTVADTAVEEWDEVIDVNLKGAYLSAKHALPHLRQRGGSIVLVSSVQAYVCQTGVSAYTVSKAGLNALARSIAIDEATHGVRANAVCPASVNTPMLQSAARLFSDGTPAGEASTLQSWGRMHPLGRVAEPAEIAEVIAFLAGPRSSFVTGVGLPVDGGLLATAGVDLS